MIDQIIATVFRCYPSFGRRLFRWCVLSSIVSTPALAIDNRNIPETGSPDKPIITTSIKPLTLIAAQLLGNSVDIRQLLPDMADPHHQHLRFSQLKQVESADLIIWLGPPAESGLDQLVSNHPNSLQLREIVIPGHGITFDDDPHIWLNPDNARMIAQAIADKLVADYPAQELLWRQRLTDFNREINRLDSEVSAYLQPYLPLHFIAEHIAFSHFANHFGLIQVGAFKDEKGSPIGARAMASLLQQDSVDCLIAESNARLEKTKALAKRWGAGALVISPLGAGIEPGGAGYNNLIWSVARQFSQCKNPAPGRLK